MKAPPTRGEAWSAPHWALDWRPARAAICSRGGCSELATDGLEWCKRHHDEIRLDRQAVLSAAIRDGVTIRSQRHPDRRTMVTMARSWDAPTDQTAAHLVDPGVRRHLGHRRRPGRRNRHPRSHHRPPGPRQPQAAQRARRAVLVLTTPDRQRSGLTPVGRATRVPRSATSRLAVTTGATPPAYVTIGAAASEPGMMCSTWSSRVSSKTRTTVALGARITRSTSIV